MPDSQETPAGLVASTPIRKTDQEPPAASAPGPIAPPEPWWLRTIRACLANRLNGSLELHFERGVIRKVVRTETFRESDPFPPEDSG